VAHALDRMDPDFPRILAGLFGSAPPIIVAYGIHVYGRAMTSGVSGHVLVDDPGKIHFGLTHLGERDTVRTPGPKRETVQPPECAAVQETVQGTGRTPVQVSGGRDPRNPERQRAFEVWDQLYVGQPVNAKEVLRLAQVSKDESTVRRWCRAWEQTASRDPAKREAAQPGIQQSA
ncbi:MAG: hypothetical protein ACRDPJ_08955, partial [Nocardioidaceae bacterium]